MTRAAQPGLRTAALQPPPGAWLGMLGSASLATGACSAMFSQGPQGWPWEPVRMLGEVVGVAPALMLFLSGYVLWSVGWWMLRPRPGVEPANRFLVLLMWSAPLLLVPPVMSQDAFLYADLGWIQALGHNPYDTGLAVLGGPYAPHVDSLWAGSGVAYPPLALRAHYAAAWLAGFHPYWGMVAQRLLAVAGVAIIAVLLPRVAREWGGSSRWATWFSVLNPFVILQYVGGAHNDALMAGIVVLGIWLVGRPLRGASLVLPPVVFGVAMAVKPQAGLAVVTVLLPVAGHLAAMPTVRRMGAAIWRLAVASAVTLATFAAACLATGLGFGWTRWLHVMGLATNDLLDLLDSLGLAPFLGVAVPALALLGIAYLVLTRCHLPIRVVALGSTLLAFVQPLVHPWYLALGLVLLGADRPPARLVKALQLGLEPVTATDAPAGAADARLVAEPK